MTVADDTTNDIEDTFLKAADLLSKDKGSKAVSMFCALQAAERSLNTLVDIKEGPGSHKKYQHQFSAKLSIAEISIPSGDMTVWRAIDRFGLFTALRYEPELVEPLIQPTKIMSMARRIVSEATRQSSFAR